jgi:hypothetical protein
MEVSPLRLAVRKWEITHQVERDATSLYIRKARTKAFPSIACLNFQIF